MLPKLAALTLIYPSPCRGFYRSGSLFSLGRRGRVFGVELARWGFPGRAAHFALQASRTLWGVQWEHPRPLTPRRGSAKRHSERFNRRIPPPI